MSSFASILVPLDGSATAARSLGCATWLAARLGARLHLLSATARELPAREELERLHVREDHWPLVELHQVSAHPQDALLDAIDRYHARLVVMTARGAAAEDTAGLRPEISKLIGHVTEAVIERCNVPVLLLPAGYREVLPWRRMLVPISGGTESDQALALAVRLAVELDLTVHVVHVAVPHTQHPEARTRYVDQLHHELAAQLEELVVRALPTHAPKERARIRSMELGRGEVASELAQIVDREQVNVLVVGWHGRFAIGHAEVLKRLLRALHIPVLLAKAVAPSKFRLRVGTELE